MKTKYDVRHFRIGKVWIDYGFSKTLGQYMYNVGTTGNAYKYEADAIAYAERLNRR